MFENLTLDQLRLFISVVEEGSFSAAGRHLDRVQSAVSQGISNLEQALGVKLFDRTARLPVLTASGRSLLLDVQQIFAQVSQLRTRAAKISEGLEPVVSVVVDAIVPADLVVAASPIGRKRSVANRESSFTLGTFPLCAKTQDRPPSSRVKGWVLADDLPNSGGFAFRMWPITMELR